MNEIGISTEILVFLSFKSQKDWPDLYLVRAAIMAPKFKQWKIIPQCVFRTINPTQSVHLSPTISSFQVCFWMTSSVNQNALNWPGNLANVGKIMHKVVFVFLRIENAFYSFDRFLKCLYIKCRKIKFVHFIVCYFLWEIAIFSL